MLAAQEVLAKPLMWSKLKEVPWAGQIRLENLAEQPALFPTATLTSEPVEFDLKVIRAGKPASTGEAPVELRLDAEPVEQTFGATSTARMIGKRTRRLLCHFRCALAVAPRGLGSAPERRLAHIAVGYDGSEESAAALALGGSIAVAGGAKLSVRGGVYERLPGVGWPSLGRDQLMSIWSELTEPMVDSLRARAQAAADATGAGAAVEVSRGRPADALMELGQQADLLVIGSRRWGAATRVLLGSTGEALLHDAGCPVLVTPRVAEHSA
jgi:nucleotide-binding universal stress UspA family protein